MSKCGVSPRDRCSFGATDRLSLADRVFASRQEHLGNRRNLSGQSDVVDALRASLRALQGTKHFFQLCNAFGYATTIVTGTVFVIHKNHSHKKYDNKNIRLRPKKPQFQSVERKIGQRNGFVAHAALSVASRPVPVAAPKAKID
jgi:hypothetical protein